MTIIHRHRILKNSVKKTVADKYRSEVKLIKEKNVYPLAPSSQLPSTSKLCGVFFFSYT